MDGAVAAVEGKGAEEARETENVVSVAVGDEYMVHLHHGTAVTHELALSPLTNVKQEPVSPELQKNRRESAITRWCGS